MLDKQENFRLQQLAHEARVNLCKLSAGYHGSIHMGGGLSMIEVMTCLFHHTMRVGPELVDDPERDRFVLSKGHGAASMYVVMAQKGLIDYDDLYATYGHLNSKFGQHPCKAHLPFLEASTGSLGHGLPISLGLAASAKQKQRQHRVFCLIGDGESCEGSIWEAAMTAPSLGLGNLVVVADRNRQLMISHSEDHIHLEPYADKWRAFGWNTIELDDGNDMNQVVATFDSLNGYAEDVPTIVIANTVKGKNVSFMERQIKWHASKINEADLVTALHDLDAVWEKEMQES